MESIDRRAMSIRVFPALQSLKKSGALTHDQLEAAIASCAEGYAFPTNLDTDPPIGGNAPKSQADILRDAVNEGWSDAKLQAELDALCNRQIP